MLIEDNLKQSGFSNEISKEYSLDNILSEIKNDIAEITSDNNQKDILKEIINIDIGKNDNILPEEKSDVNETKINDEYDKAQQIITAVSDHVLIDNENDIKVPQNVDVNEKAAGSNEINEEELSENGQIDVQETKAIDESMEKELHVTQNNEIQHIPEDSTNSEGQIASREQQDIQIVSAQLDSDKNCIEVENMETDGLLDAVPNTESQSESITSHDDQKTVEVVETSQIAVGDVNDLSSNEFENIEENENVEDENVDDENVEYEYEVSDDEDIDEEIQNVERLNNLDGVIPRVNGEDHEQAKDDTLADNIMSDVSNIFAQLHS